MAVDARQTPDRGSLGLIAELADHAQSVRVWLAGVEASAVADPHAGAGSGGQRGTDAAAGPAPAGRLRQWREGLAGIGLGGTGAAGQGGADAGVAVFTDAAAARAWLEHGDEAR